MFVYFVDLCRFTFILSYFILSSCASLRPFVLHCVIIFSAFSLCIFMLCIWAVGKSGTPGVIPRKWSANKPVPSFSRHGVWENLSFKRKQWQGLAEVPNTIPRKHVVELWFIYLHSVHLLHLVHLCFIASIGAYLSSFCLLVLNFVPWCLVLSNSLHFCSMYLGSLVHSCFILSMRASFCPPDGKIVETHGDWSCRSFKNGGSNLEAKGDEYFLGHLTVIWQFSRGKKSGILKKPGMTWPRNRLVLKKVPSSSFDFAGAMHVRNSKKTQ